MRHHVHVCVCTIVWAGVGWPQAERSRQHGKGRKIRQRKSEFSMRKLVIRAKWQSNKNKKQTKRRKSCWRKTETSEQCDAPHATAYCSNNWLRLARLLVCS